MTIMEQGSCPKRNIDTKTKMNMERCANFLVQMVEKYGKEVLAELGEQEDIIAIDGEENTRVISDDAE